MKKRRDFDEELNNDIKTIDTLSLDGINEFIHEKKIILNKINIWINESNITNGRKRFLKGWRKKETKSLSYSKKRINKINNEIQKLTNNEAKQFIKNSANILPQNIFQKIYITSMINKEENK